MLSVGDVVCVEPEKPVAGGRMLARLSGEIVLVAGALPDEQVAARIERRQQGVWLAATVDVLRPSTDRCDPGPDPGCGGMAFAHVRYPRQCELKAAIVSDAMAHIARIRVAGPVPVTPSPTVGYRARYRVHPDRGRLGFFREGTHVVCDPAPSGQLAAASLDCLGRLAAALPDEAGEIEALEFIEDLPNTRRAVNLVLREQTVSARALLTRVAGVPGLAGASATRGRGTRIVDAVGEPWVSDPAGALAASPAGDADGAVIRRHAAAFFQANRYLTPVLARRVTTLAGDGPVVDLYAGAGLFGVALAAAGHEQVTAIESDRLSAADLAWNARQFPGRLAVVRATVEEYVGRATLPGGVTLILDPPRTGMSRAAITGVIALSAATVLYVSCDVATLARDARRLIDAGYGLRSLEALDLFPNTAHVEALAVFDRPR
jgi:23S rRNA (uracil1939-C5)-methyltransferase